MKIQCPLVYLTCHGLSNKVDPIFDLFMLEFQSTLHIMTSI
jgi:hypothetical protein